SRSSAAATSSTDDKTGTLIPRCYERGNENAPAPVRRRRTSRVGVLSAGALDRALDRALRIDRHQVLAVVGRCGKVGKRGDPVRRLRRGSSDRFRVATSAGERTPRGGRALW